MASLVPLFIMAATAYTQAAELAGAPPPRIEAVMAGLTKNILFLILAGGVLAVLVSLFLSNSISPPLRAVTRAMDRVARGEFDLRVEPVTNDEIGALTDGFNRMAAGLAERERLRKTFDRYVDKEIATQILEGESNVEGEMKDVSVLFADLRGFTTFTESRHPREVLAKLNRYFSAMTAAVRAHRGVVFQYVGDEIYAVFGAPAPNPLHADDAFTAARRMRQALVELNQEWTEAGEEAFRQGIGLHSGLALAGNVGSEDRQSYALVGDTINTAARVAELCKRFEWDFLITEDAFRRLSRPEPLEALAPVEIRGRQGKIVLFKA